MEGNEVNKCMISLRRTLVLYMTKHIPLGNMFQFLRQNYGITTTFLVDRWSALVMLVAYILCFNVIWCISYLLLSLEKNFPVLKQKNALWSPDCKLQGTNQDQLWPGLKGTDIQETN